MQIHLATVPAAASHSITKKSLDPEYTNSAAWSMQYTPPVCAASDAIFVLVFGSYTRITPLLVPTQTVLSGLPPSAAAAAEAVGTIESST